MGAIAGVYGSSDDTKRDVENLLLALRHRGANTSTKAMEDEHGGWAIGCASDNGLETHFLESGRCTLALDGSFFRRKNPVRFAYSHLTKCTTNEAVTDLMSEPGESAALGHIRGKMFAFRDPNGLKPLYYAERHSFVAFASERKALWANGLREVKRVPPGHLLSISKRGMRRTRLFRLINPREKPMAFEDARSRLARHLKRSVRRITTGISKAAVAFSGGLDSAVTAALAKSNCEVELVSVGLSGSAELSTVEKYARELDLPISIEQFDSDSLEEYVRRVVWLIEEPNLMKVSVAVPLHWAARVAARLRIQRNAVRSRQR